MARILVVEDHPANLRLARLILESDGHDVLCMENARDIVRTAAAHHFDLILMDIQLPGIDGIEATRRLRSAGETSAVPILAVTASVMDSDVERVMQAGCNGCLTKPYRRAQLLSAVAQVLRGENHGDGAAAASDPA
jgi:two-component system cell cycle response regulator DivK